MAYTSLVSLILAYVVLFHGGLAYPTECDFENLTTLEPTKQVESEGGVTEYWDSNNRQFQCVGVAALRYTIKPKGLLLPLYINAPRVQYVLQGTGILETVISGCRQTFREESSEGDMHQKIHVTREGDVIVVPAGAAQWIYNTGETDLVLFSLIDSANGDNQLDLKVRKFFLAGNPKEEPKGMGEGHGTNVFSGMAHEMVEESLDVNDEIATKVQGLDDPRGSIVTVKVGLDILSPVQEEEQQQRERGEGRQKLRGVERANGLEENICTLRLVHQLAEATDADKYNPRAGYLTGLNTPNLPVLKYVRLGVDRGVLYKNAMMVPHHNLNCHSVIYGTEGSSWIQVVAENGVKVFDGEVRKGQILIVPQHFVVVKKAGGEGFGWIAVKTNDNPMMNALAGELSLIRSMPEAVLMHSYLLSREQVKELKKRRELTLLSPRVEPEASLYY